jgi:hypothetical protein
MPFFRLLPGSHMVVKQKRRSETKKEESVSVAKGQS